MILPIFCLYVAYMLPIANFDAYTILYDAYAKKRFSMNAYTDATNIFSR